jgi:hypothetical protein
VISEGASVDDIIIDGFIDQMAIAVEAELQGFGEIGSLDIHSDGVYISADLLIDIENIRAAVGVLVQIGDYEYLGTGEGIERGDN